MGSGRNTLITDHIAGIIAINDVPNYPNLTPLTAANVKYGTSLQKNINAILTQNRKLIILGLGTTYVDDLTIGGHQWLKQEMYAYICLLGADTETDQKLAVTVGEEVETYFYSDRRVSSDWMFAGRQRMTPQVWSHGKNNVVRTFLMELRFKKFGTEGVP